MTIPHNHEAEESLLGSIMINPAVFPIIRGMLKPADFHKHEHQWIYQTFCNLDDKKQDIDYVTVSEGLGSKLKAVGGAAFLTRLMTNVPSSTSAESYAQIVKSYSVRRNMIAAAEKIANMAHDENVTIEDAISSGEKAWREAVDNSITQDAESMEAILNEIEQRFVAAERGDVRHGTPTGFGDLDKLLGV